MTEQSSDAVIDKARKGEHRYITTQVQGTELSTNILGGQIFGVRAWIFTLVGASIEDVEKVRQWLQAIIEAMKETGKDD